MRCAVIQPEAVPPFSHQLLAQGIVADGADVFPVCQISTTWQAPAGMNSGPSRRACCRLLRCCCCCSCCWPWCVYRRFRNLACSCICCSQPGGFPRFDPQQIPQRGKLATQLQLSTRLVIRQLLQGTAEGWLPTLHLPRRRANQDRFPAVQLTVLRMWTSCS